MATGTGSSGNQSIRFNEIMNGHVGINAYNTTSEIINNNIHDNDFGIKINNNCNTNLEGNPYSGDLSQTQQIMDNSSYELYFSSGSFPWNFQYNIIVDEDNAGNPTDPMVYYQLPVTGIPLHDVRNNCWGSNFLPADDFYGGIYYHLPVWCPPAFKTASVNLDSAKVLYMQAKTEFDSANYTTAKTKFMEVISNYSITKYAPAAMKDMFALEQFENDNYQWLKIYYQTDSIIQNDTIIKDLSNFLANKCDIELQNWPLAINHYEEIIQNPPSYEDSIFAVIDLGQLYLLMENTDTREIVQGKLSEYIPSSKMSFIINRNYLLSLLPKQKSNSYNYDENNQNKGGKLLQNQPNPFSGKTTIKYLLLKAAHVSISVYSNNGTAVRKLEFDNKDGSYYVDIDLTDLPAGVYYYSLVIDGQDVDSKKMLMIK